MQDIEFEDEFRVGTRTDLGRKWSPVGVRPVGRQKIGYDYLYLYVSIKAFVGEVFARFLPRLDKQCFGIFAAERARRTAAQNLADFRRSGSASAGGGQPVVGVIEVTRLRAGVESGGAIFSGVATEAEIPGVRDARRSGKLCDGSTQGVFDGCGEGENFNSIPIHQRRTK